MEHNYILNIRSYQFSPHGCYNSIVRRTTERN